MYFARDLRVVKAKPAPTMRMLWSSIASTGHPFPYGPLTPIFSPTMESWRAVVTTPTLFTVNSRVPPSMGDEANPMGHSPAPK